jgi:HSP20 family molecular chaperone IbpA
MRKHTEQIFGEFERVIDQFFDELLIERWRAGGQFEPAEIVNRQEHYEIRIVAEGIDPATIEVESLGSRLTVRATDRSQRKIQRSFRFEEIIDADAASARWSNGTLTITLPKQRTRRISLKEF